MNLLTAEEMRQLDRRTIEEIGIPGAVLMENAGRAAAEVLIRRFTSLNPGPVLVLSGKGNNGGDGYVVARCLADRGWRVRTVALARREEIAGDAALHLEILLRSGGDVSFAPDEESLRSVLGDARDFALVVDALFGTGLSSAITGHAGVAVEWINGTGRPVMAMDIPSGVDGSTGQVHGPCVRADLTVTFAFPKVGHASYPGAGFIGQLERVDIGIPRCLAGSAGDGHLLVDAAEARLLLPARPVEGHKGTFGHLLAVGGSTGKGGALAMTAEGGMRIGAGLVTAACPASLQPILAIKLTEAMTAPLPEVDGALSLQALGEILSLTEGKDALALGPGIGSSEEARALIRRLVRECPLPLVLDADGLNALAEHPEILLERSGPPVVLTPHPGEMARLAGTTPGKVQDDRIGAAREFARRFRVVLVLKGAGTVIALPDGRIRINGSGNPGLANGGMGDVLTGIIGGLLVQGLSPEKAAAVGVFLHGHAADRLARTLGTAGMIATDLLRELPATRQTLAKESP